MSRSLEDRPASSEADKESLCFSEGIYYAWLSHPASESPLKVALHGVMTYEQAAQALSILTSKTGLHRSKSRHVLPQAQVEW